MGKYIRTAAVTFCIVLHLTLVVHGQPRRCQFLTSGNWTSITQSPAPTVYIENSSASKCLRIGDFGHHESKVSLDQCFWSVTTLTKDTKLYVKKNNAVSDGLTIYNDAGLGQSYCLTFDRTGHLETTSCIPSSREQIWIIKTVRGYNNLFQIQQVSSSLCLVPQSGSSSKPNVILSPCNSYQTEQLWKLCSETK